MLGVPALAHRPHSKAKEQTTPVLNEYLAGTTAVMKVHVEEGWIYFCMVMIVKLTRTCIVFVMILYLWSCLYLGISLDTVFVRSFSMSI